MTTHLGKLLILICLFGCVLTMATLLFRAHAPLETQTVTQDRTAIQATAMQAPAGTQKHQTSRALLLSKSLRLVPASEQPSTAELRPTEPPDDPDECRQWARENPELALAWLASAQEGPQRDALVETVCAKIAESNPAQAVALAEQYATNNTYLLANLVYQWSQRDAEARAYALAKPKGEQRDHLLARVALTRAKEDPIDAAMLVVQEITPGEIQNEAAMSVVHQWALLNPTQALGWVELFPEGELRTRALNEIENILRHHGAQQPTQAGR